MLATMTVLDAPDVLFPELPKGVKPLWMAQGKRTWVQVLSPWVWGSLAFSVFLMGVGVLTLVYLVLLLGYDPSYTLSDLLLPLPIALLGPFFGWSLLKQLIEQFRQMAQTVCLATATHLYVFTPAQGTRSWSWAELPPIRARLYAAGVFSLYYHDSAGKVMMRFLFEYVAGDRSTFERLQALQQAATSSPT